MKEFIEKYKTNLIFVFGFGFGIYFFILFSHDISQIMQHIKTLDYRYILLVVFMFFIYMTLESWVLHLFTKCKVKGLGYFDAFRLNLSTQFFNSVTPFSSGGQPFQVYYLNKRGIKVKDATSIVMMNFITYSLAFVIVGFLSLIFKYAYFNRLLEQEGYSYLLLIGFGINVFVTVLTFVLAFSRKLYHLLVEVIWLKMVNWPILRKFKLENKTTKIREFIDDFNREIKELNQHKLLWLESVIFHILRIVVVYSIPLFIFKALGESVDDQVINLIVGGFFVAMIMSYIPSPGASGGAEGLFYIIFSSFFKNESIIITAMLLWRFITYYLFLILGFFSLFTLKYHKDLDKLNYQNESDITFDS